MDEDLRVGRATQASGTCGAGFWFVIGCYLRGKIERQGKKSETLLDSVETSEEYVIMHQQRMCQQRRSQALCPLTPLKLEERARERG